jgi:hypothetical protein
MPSRMKTRHELEPDHPSTAVLLWPKHDPATVSTIYRRVVRVASTPPLKYSEVPMRRRVRSCVSWGATLVFALAACDSANDAPPGSASGAGGASGATGGSGGVLGGNAGMTSTGGVGGATGGSAGSGAIGGSGATMAGASATTGGAASGAAGSGGVAAGSGGMGGAGLTAGAGDGGTAGTSGSSGSAGVPGVIAEELDIADVWSGHPVGFYLLTRQDRQFVAFYDSDRALTIGDRALGETTWKFARLPTAVEWDSHNDIVMAIDDDGFIHVAGNMHSSPLIYFRTSAALDIDTFQKLPMVSMNETSCTYPQFFRSPSGQLVFMYRDGSSGNGNHIFNAYDTSNKTWSRLLGSALTDGEGQRNAYPVGPIQGPDGLFHLVWVWRDTPDATTNHDLSYARTTNLLNWQKAGGQALTLPMQLSTAEIVDPVPSGGGMINNNTKVGFDAEMRPIVAYHKFDQDGNTQLYNARFENGAWVVHQTSSWDYRWDFGGGGTLVFEIEVQPVEVQSNGTLTQNYYHSQYGGLGAFRLNPTSLVAEATIPQPVPYPSDLAEVESPTPMMEVRWRKDAGIGPDAETAYMLRWETLPSNRDMPRSPIPPPTKLRLYGFRVEP